MLTTTEDERICLAIWDAATRLTQRARFQRSLCFWTLTLLTTAYPDYADRWDDLAPELHETELDVAFAIASVFPPFAVVQWRVECSERLLDLDEMLALRDAITQYHEPYWSAFDRSTIAPAFRRVLL